MDSKESVPAESKVQFPSQTYSWESLLGLTSEHGEQLLIGCPWQARGAWWARMPKTDSRTWGTRSQVVGDSHRTGKLRYKWPVGEESREQFGLKWGLRKGEKGVGKKMNRREMQTVWAVTLGRTLSRVQVHTAAGCRMSMHIQVCSRLRLALSCPWRLQSLQGSVQLAGG